MYRTALVTGGTRGIGRATVIMLAKKGYRVAFCYKNSSELAESLVREMQQSEHYVCAYKCDVSSYKEVQELYKKTKADLGTIDTIVNNASISRFCEFIQESESGFDSMVSTNLKSVFNVCKAYACDMVSSGFGRIVNISSVWGQKGASMESLYAMTKGGVDSLTKSLAKELALSKVTVNAVSPGMICTDMNNHLSEKEKCEFLKNVPLGKIGSVEDVADAILYLCSKEASYTTGQILTISGGF